MKIPTPVEQLNIPNALFTQTPGEQTVIGEAGSSRLRPIGIQCLFRFFGDVHHFRNGHLHPKRQLILSDSSQRFRMSQFFRLHLIQIVQGIQGFAPQTP